MDLSFFFFFFFVGGAANKIHLNEAVLASPQKVYVWNINTKIEPRHVISNNAAVLKVKTQISLY